MPSTLGPPFFRPSGTALERHRGESKLRFWQTSVGFLPAEMIFRRLKTV
jgi:hypothetical protein